MSEWDFEYDDDRDCDTFCPECEEQAPLSPLSGLCFDCENSIDEDDESGEDEEVCEECGDSYPEDQLVDGVCSFCLEEE